MERNDESCPQCHEPLRPTMVECYGWRPQDEPAAAERIGVETLLRCLYCAETFFPTLNGCEAV